MSAAGQISVVWVQELERSSLMSVSVRIDVTFHVGISASMFHSQAPLALPMLPEKSEGWICNPLIGSHVGPPLAVRVTFQSVVLV